MMKFPLLKFLFKISRWLVAIAALYLGLFIFKGGADMLKDWSLTLGMPWLTTFIYVLFGVAGILALLELVLDLMEPQRF